MATNRADILTDEDRELLLQRYLDVEWCDDVTHLRCVRCHRVAISHYVSNCQHLFCRNCRTIFSDGGQWKCPDCNQYVTLLNDQDVNTENELIQSKVCCPNKKYGCQHVDQVKNITNHMKVCENTREAALPMEYTGANTMDLLYRQVSGLSDQLRQMSDDMRVMKSESEANWKQMQAKMNELEQKVDNNVDIYNRYLNGFRSDLNFQAEKLINEKLNALEQHSKDERNKVLEQLEAMMERMKQSEMFIRAELTSRDAILKECQEKIDEMGRKDEVEIVQRSIDEMKAQMHDDGGEMRLKMSLIEAEMKAVPALPLDLNQVIRVNTEVVEWNIDITGKDTLNGKTTEVLQMQGYPFGLQVKLSLSSFKRISMSHRFIDIYNTGRLATQSMPKIIYAIQDQSVNDWDRKDDVIIYCDTSFSELLEYDHYIGPWPLCDYSRLLNAPYNKDNSIKIKILVEPPSIANSFASNDGVFYWRVDNYSDRKRMEEEGLAEFQESPYFYTAPQGYRMEAAINLNKMTAWIEMYKGKYDDKLARLFNHQITITLFNQTDPTMNLVKSYVNHLQYNNYLQLCEASEMEKCGFVKNDVLLLKFVVEELSN